jgi:hypothetical protein
MAYLPSILEGPHDATGPCVILTMRGSVDGEGLGAVPVTRIVTVLASKSTELTFPTSSPLTAALLPAPTMGAGEYKVSRGKLQIS